MWLALQLVAADTGYGNVCRQQEASFCVCILTVHTAGVPSPSTIGRF